MRPVVVNDQVHVELLWDALLYHAQEDEELVMAVSAVELRHHGAVEYVECREEINRPVALDSHERDAGAPRRRGKTVWFLLSACMPVLSSKQITTALSGGFIYRVFVCRPSPSVTLSLNSESLLGLKERSR